MTTNLSQLRKDVESLVVNHGAQLMALQHIDRAIKDSLDGFEKTVEVLVGPSRAGKSEIIRMLKEKYPPQRVDGRLVCPVLFVPIKSGVSPKDLPLHVLRALKVPRPRRASRQEELNTRMYEQLELAGVQAVVFEECSHLVDVGSKVPPRQASDWFKDLMESQANVTVILVGLPRLIRLLSSNEQLCLRSGAPFYFLPYQWALQPDRAQFAGVCKAYVTKFEHYGCNFPVPLATLVRQLYAISAGTIGVLVKFFRFVAALVRSPGLISMADLDGALKRLNRAGDRQQSLSAEYQPAFEELLVDDHDLLLQYRAELDVYKISAPTITEKRIQELKAAYEVAHAWRAAW